MTTALNQYTQQDYKSINRKLRYGKTDNTVPQILEDLKNVKTFTGRVYRGLVLDKSQIRDTFKVGQVYRDMGFMSCSKNEVVAQKFNCLGVPPSRTDNRSVTLILESKTGRDIRNISKYPEEMEVLFAPLTNFEVISVDVDGWEEYTIVLKEV
ncbi:MAG: ADP-ribosyltransferase domain-containing protein [Sphaerospermopsis kisseleviana]